MCCLRSGLALFFLVTLTPGQVILRVGPGQAFTALQPAIDAAQPGDRILVEAGYYQGPIRVNKGVRITWPSGTAIASGIHFDLIPAGQTATMSGASVTAPTVGLRGATAVQITHCAGLVSLERGSTPACS